MTMKTQWLFLAITISVLPFIQCTHVLHLGSPRVNNQGTWKAWERCHDGWFVHGMQLKYETVGSDITGMNAVALYCQRIGLDSFNKDNRITGGEGPWGSWQEVQFCPQGTFVVGFNLRSEEHEDGRDNIAADNFAARCGTEERPDNEMYQYVVERTLQRGTFTGWQLCPRGYGVCGIQTQIQEQQGSDKDDTSLNNVNLECCLISKSCIECTRVHIHSPHVNTLGEWHPWARCGDGKYAHGIQIKYEQDREGADNTALNAVVLYCQSFGHEGINKTNRVMSGEGAFGSWQSIIACSIGTVIIGFALRSEPYQGHRKDSLGAVNFMAHCGTLNGPRNVTDSIQGDSSSNGNWSSDQFCPENYVVCGIQSQIQWPNSGTDGENTALNNINLECCQVPGTCVPGYSMIKLAEYDNSKGEGTVSASFERKTSYARKSGKTVVLTEEERHTIYQQISASVSGKIHFSMSGNFNYQRATTDEIFTSTEVQKMLEDAMTNERTETMSFTVPAKSRLLIEQLFITCGEHRIGLAKTVSRTV